MHNPNQEFHKTFMEALTSSPAIAKMKELAEAFQPQDFPENKNPDWKEVDLNSALDALFGPRQAENNERSKPHESSKENGTKIYYNFKNLKEMFSHPDFKENDKPSPAPASINEQASDLIKEWKQRKMEIQVIKKCINDLKSLENQQEYEKAIDTLQNIYHNKLNDNTHKDKVWDFLESLSQQ